MPVVSSAMARRVGAGCRASLLLPLRGRPAARAPKIHPGTGMPLSKVKGQHLIHNHGVLMKMVEAADLRSSDAVLEVGCGTGELTQQLLPLVRRVYAVDVETRMVQETQLRAQSSGFSNLEAYVGDAVRLPLPKRFDVCVSNLPYKISSPMIFRLMKRLSEGPPWRAAVLMVQREFAERLLADPGEKPFSRLAINVRLFARSFRIFDVKPGSFIPAPKVHSTVIRLEPRLPGPEVDFSEWDAMIRILFSRRRKTLRTQFKAVSTLSMLEYNHKIWCSLSGQQPSSRPFPELVLSVLEEQGCVYARAFAMDLDELLSLLRAFHRKGIRFVNVQGAYGADGKLIDGEPGSDDEGGYVEGAGYGAPGNSPPPHLRGLPPPPPARPAEAAGGARDLGASRTGGGQPPLSGRAPADANATLSYP